MSDQPVITREQIAAMLRAWQAGLVSTQEISDWGENNHPSEHDDWEDWKDDEESVSNVIMSELDMLRLNLRLPEDAPILLDFLATPRGEFGSGYKVFNQRLDSIDYEKRRQQLKNDPIYWPFCK